MTASRPSNDTVDTCDSRTERIALHNEWHDRPGLSMPAPLRCSHVVTLRGEATVDEARAQFGQLCREHGQAEPLPRSRYHSVQIGACLLKWEGHTEADSYTVMVAGAGQPGFTESALDFLDAGWREALLQDMFIGVQVEVVPSTGDTSDNVARARALLGASTVYGGTMSRNSAEVWSAFRLDANDFIRLVVVDRGANQERMARLLQRLLELETYRLLAMLALPRAREVFTTLSELEPKLDSVMSQLAGSSDDADQEDLLRQLTGIAAQVEHVAAANAYRFAATRAYGAIVERRIAEVDEQQVGSQPRYSIFLQKALLPALRTCNSAEKRTRELADRINRATGLLNSMVDMVQKRQNHAIMETLASNAGRQLRLQQAVEGFSIFAISYYAVGLLGYLLKALKTSGLPVNPDLATGFAAPLVFAGVWLSVRSVKRRLVRPGSSG